MKVIFLDVDGVLNHYGSGSFDKKCLENLAKITKTTGAKIVLISSWRMVYDENGRAKHKWAAIFEHNLELFGMELFARAPYLGDKRSDEVSLFLRENDVSNYLIIDDTDYDYSKNHPENWVRTDPANFGLTLDLAQKSIEILSKN